MSSRALFSAGFRFVVLIAGLSAIVCAAAGAPAASNPPATIVLDAGASAVEHFAGRELQRYIFLRTGTLLPVETADRPPSRPAIRLTTRRPATVGGVDAAPGRQEYLISSTRSESGVQLSIVGGDAIGALYGAYRLIEHLGVRFYLHGDVVPDETVPFALPEINERGRPLFQVRGILPFHDFAEGPDWWNRDDYLSVVGQLAKLRMNFFGLHTYPEGGVGPEPTVWIGTRGDYDDAGRVRTAYPATYHTTLRGGKYWWAYDPLATSAFVAGAAQLFPRDDFGAEVMSGHTFEQQTPAGAVEVFNRTGELLGEAFREARRLGIRTCVGTETPLTLPASVAAALKASGQNPADPATVRSVYAAMFERLSRISPVDYYWLWTTEGWTWEGNKPDDFRATETDIRAALGALEDLRSPVTLATSGWVLGPQHDRAALDKLLPPASPMSAINPAVGHGAIERQFANLSPRPRWAIPWLENDPNLTGLQLWAGRMRFDAADALRLGCDGLIGIHWRTAILAPNVAALSAAAWDQSWVPAEFDRTPLPPQTASGAIGGRPVGQADGGPIDPAGSGRVGMSAYDTLIPKGVYTVTLGFSELEGRKAGERIFDVTVQGKTAAAGLDIAARGGKATLVLRDVGITDARLLIEFHARTGESEISSIEVEGVTEVGKAAYARRINCGGPALRDFEADLLAGSVRPPESRGMPVREFYRDFAQASFGAGVAAEIGAIFESIDGRGLPEPANWIAGPGDILRNRESWEKVAPRYAFVETLAALRPRVSGAGNQARFDYWLSQFRALRLLGELGCTAGALDREMEALPIAGGAAELRAAAVQRALPLRLRLASLWTELLHVQIAGIQSVGELGTIANLEQRSRRNQHLLDRHDAALVKALGEPLPEAAAPPRQYAGAPRLVVPTVRTSAHRGEVVRVRVLCVAARTTSAAFLEWRPLGREESHRVPLRHLGRWVYEAELPALGESLPAIEYRIEAQLAGQPASWPATASGRGQTVVLFD